MSAPCCLQVSWLPISPEPREEPLPVHEEWHGWAHWLRGLATRVSHNPDFEMVVILLIIGNCVSLALYQPLLGDQAEWNITLNDIELAFNVMFTVEMLLR
jgi:hypothetical protein